VGHKIWSSFCEACGLFGPKCDYTPGDPELAEEFKEHFGLVLADMEIWLNEIFPRDPTLEDRKALARYEKAIEVAGEKLERIRKLLA